MPAQLTSTARRQGLKNALICGIGVFVVWLAVTLVVLSANPLERIADTRAIELVVHDGRPHEPTGLPAAAAKPARGQVPPGLREIVSETFSPVLKPDQGQTEFPAVMIGILHGGERYVIEYGRSGADGAAAEHTLFPVASLTKPVTALLLAKMAAMGAIDLDAPAVSCDLHPNLCPDGAPITWRHLATHTSGLPAVPDDLGQSMSGYGADRLEAYLGRVELRRPPGSGFEYSTTGFALLGSSLAGRRGRTFPQLLREEVLEPLGMSDSHFTLGPEELPRLAVGHRSDGTPIERPARADVFAPSGGLITTVSDLLVFLEANIRPDEHWRRPVELLLQTHDDIPSYPPSVMALGWQYLTPAGFYWHAGHASGYHAFMTFHRPGGTAVVVLTNAGTHHRDTRLAMASFGLMGRLLQGE